MSSDALSITLFIISSIITVIAAMFQETITKNRKDTFLFLSIAIIMILLIIIIFILLNQRG